MTLSTGLHGGLAFYDWSMNPTEGGPTQAPVAVSLLPAVDVAPSVQQDVSQVVSDPVPLSAPPLKKQAKKTVAAKPLRAITAKPVERASQKTAEEPLTTDVDNLSPVESDVSAPPVEMADAIPQSELADIQQLLPESNLANAEKVETAVESTGAASKLQPEALQRIEEGLLADAAYANEELVQAVPKYRSNPLPEYPYQARKKHWEGIVWLLVDVSADGFVDELRVEKSCGYRVLDRTASRAVKRWQFTPAKRAGLPVLSQVRIPVRFHLDDD